MCVVLNVAGVVRQLVYLVLSFPPETESAWSIQKKNWFEQWQCFKGIREEHMVVFCGLWMPKSQVFSGKETPKTPRFVPSTFGPAHLVDVSCKSPKIG